MSKHRRAAKIDKNQPEIVKQLRAIQGVTVQPGMDDILIGYKGNNYWIELKDDDCVSNKTGKILESAIKPSQKKLREEWKGNYHILHSLSQILEVLEIDVSEKQTDKAEGEGATAINS